MKGNNTLNFNHDTMVEAVEHYLNTVLFKDKVIVHTVTENKNNSDFLIKIEPVTEDDRVEIIDGSN